MCVLGAILGAVHHIRSSMPFLDYARAEQGGKIVLSTCADELHPPENVLDPNDSTFWATTGLFPHELVVAVTNNVHVSKITTLSMNGGRQCALECAV